MGNLSIKIESDKKIKTITVDTTGIEKSVDKIGAGIEKFLGDTFKVQSYTKDEKK
jgi:hypothetical protein